MDASRNWGDSGYMRIAVKQARPSTQLWSDLETFIDLGDENLIPAPVSRVIQQIQVEYRHVDKILGLVFLTIVRRVTSFSFSMLDSPQQGHEKEFLEYKKYFLNH